MNTKYNKNNFILILIIMLLLNITNLFAQSGWYNLNLSFGGGGIYFKDLNNGIISGHKTTNGGNSWYNVSLGSHLSFPDPNTGYAYTGFLYKTTNFGDNWVMQNNPSTQFFNSIRFPNVNTGYSCGEGGEIIKTTNGGNNWIIIEPIAAPLKYGYFFASVFFTDELTGFITGYKYANDTSVFIKTTNGGINWLIQRYHVNTLGKFGTAFFTSATTGFVGAASNFNILKTTNAGVNWSVSFIPTTNNIYSIHFPSASTGYASCFGGQILKTTNGGSNWFLQTTGTGSILYSVFFINDLTGYCSGDNNTVLKTTDGGGPPIGITPISSEIPKEFALGQNYPNPFNPITNFEFHIAKSGLVNITIYDAMGREVETLFNAELSLGIYKADWNASKYPSGIYFYRLNSIGFNQTKKMILIK